MPVSGILLPDIVNSQLARAAEAIAAADALLVTAGAGMGVDSGLPDFRGDQGFWKAYPAYGQLGLSFAQLANPRWFRTDPAFAWGFYGHRLELYRATAPHTGFAILREWGAHMRHGSFVYTSNVDGHFQRAGFDPERVLECHGALAMLQCLDDCGVGLFPADPYRVVVDPTTFRAAPPLPACPRCGALARPNVLMFGDGGWDDTRAEEQDRRMRAWLEDLAAARARVAVHVAVRVVVIECGAGTAIPTVRMRGEAMIHEHDATLIRINVREAEGGRGTISLAGGALAMLQGIGSHLPAR